MASLWLSANFDSEGNSRAATRMGSLPLRQTVAESSFCRNLAEPPIVCITSAQVHLKGRSALLFGRLRVPQGITILVTVTDQSCLLEVQS